MAYFPNGSAGERFEDQCSKCKYGDSPCPIAWVQVEFNYEAANNKTAILEALVKDDGACMMYKTFKDDLHNPNYATPDLF